LDVLEFVRVPGFEQAVFGCGEYEMAFFAGVDGMRDEAATHDGVVVGEEGFVAVAEVEAPDAEVLVGGGGGEEFAIGADGEGEDGEFVAVEGEEEFETVGEEDFDGGVEGAEGEEARVGSEGEGENVVR